MKWVQIIRIQQQVAIWTWTKAKFDGIQAATNWAILNMCIHRECSIIYHRHERRNMWYQKTNIVNHSETKIIEQPMSELNSTAEHRQKWEGHSYFIQYNTQKLIDFGTYLLAILNIEKRYPLGLLYHANATVVRSSLGQYWTYVREIKPRPRSKFGKVDR